MLIVCVFVYTYALSFGILLLYGYFECCLFPPCMIASFLLADNFFSLFCNIHTGNIQSLQHTHRAHSQTNPLHFNVTSMQAQMNRTKRQAKIIIQPRFDVCLLTFTFILLATSQFLFIKYICCYFFCMYLLFHFRRIEYAE